MNLEERAKSILSQSGLSLDKNLINQNTYQNYINAITLFKSNVLHVPHSTCKLVKDYPTLSRPSNAYTHTLISLDPNKINLKYNTLSSSMLSTPYLNVESQSNFALSLNNPYFYTQQETAFHQGETVSNLHNAANEDRANGEFLAILNDLKSLYTGPSLADKTNQNRSEKLSILFDYFSKSNKDLKLNEKDCLVYRNLQTNIKFAVYVDAFVKHHEESRSKSFPMYFQEIFLDKILKSQIKFKPTIRYTSAKQLTRRIKKVKKAKRGSYSRRSKNNFMKQRH